MAKFRLKGEYLYFGNAKLARLTEGRVIFYDKKARCERAIQVEELVRLIGRAKLAGQGR